MYIILAIIAFGVLIFVHELGHFTAAKACGVKVTEFAMGMGPQLLHFQRGETTYSLRALPVGGFCAMEGEEEHSDDPRAFNNQSVPKRLAILAAGSFMNFLLGFVLLLILYAPSQGFASPVIAGFFPECPYTDALQEGDTVYRINGERIYFTSNFSEFLSMDQDGTVDMELRRNGEKVLLKDYHIVPVPYDDGNGGTVMKYGIYFDVEKGGLVNTVRYSWYNCLDFIRMVRMGLSQLFRGQAAVSDMTGVVGIVDIINETGQSAPTTAQGLENVIDLVAFIAVNLSVMNLLPIPALDGGRIFFLVITWVIEKIIRRRCNPRVEGYVHYVGMILLLGLMAVIMISDVVKIFHG